MRLMMSFKKSSNSLLFLIVLALTAWSILLSRQTAPIKPAAHNNKPDAFMENVVTTVMNKTGTPALKISTPKMVHYPDKDLTDISQPDVIVFRQSPEPWHITANFAKATHGIEQITFLKNVVIHHAADSADPNTTMKTASLVVLPDQEKARTADPIVIIQPDMVIHAVGMLANLSDGTVKLLSKSQGEYEPNS
jgi:lipopolysaccharide export system protein LptC